MRRILFVIISIHIASFVYSENTKRDSLTVLLKDYSDSKNEELLYKLGEAYVSVNQDSSIYYLDQVLNSNLYDSIDYAKTYILQGKALYFKCDYTNAIAKVEKALELKDKLSLTDKADCYNILGNAFSNMENYKLSISSYLSSLNVRNQLADTLLISRSLNNIGNVYFQLEDYSNALRYYNESLVFKKKVSDQKGIAVIYNNQANIYHKLGEKAKSISFYIKALVIADELDNVVWKPTLLENIGKYYLDTEEYDKSLVYYRRALLEGEARDSKIDISSVKAALGNVFLMRGEYDKSLGFLQEALKISKEISVPVIELDCYQNLASLYEHKSNYKESVYFYKKYDNLKDSLNRVNNSREIAEIQSKYQVEQFDRENEILRQRNTIQKLEIDSQKNRTTLLSAIGVFVLGFVVYSFYVARIRKKINRILTDKNKVIYQKNNDLSNLNSTKDRFLSIVAHDLKNPFNAVLGFTDLLMDRYEELDDSMRQEYIEIIHKSASHGSLLLETLLTWSRSQMGVMSYNPVSLNINQLLRDEIESLEEKAFAKNIELYFPEKEPVLVFIDTDMIRTVIRNLGNNAIKFTNEKGKISFSVQIENSQALIKVSDNGVGINKVDADKLFMLDTNYSTAGTLNEKGTGLGLILCKDFVEKNNGEIGVDSEPGIGSCFWFSLPLFVENEHKKTSTHKREEEVLIS